MHRRRVQSGNLNFPALTAVLSRLWYVLRHSEQVFFSTSSPATFKVGNRHSKGCMLLTLKGSARKRALHTHRNLQTLFALVFAPSAQKSSRFS